MSDKKYNYHPFKRYSDLNHVRAQTASANILNNLFEQGVELTDNFAPGMLVMIIEEQYKDLFDEQKETDK